MLNSKVFLDFLYQARFSSGLQLYCNKHLYFHTL